MVSRSRSFRGLMIAASLKQQMDEWGCTHFERFRGLMIAASLKRVLPWPDYRRRRHVSAVL